jgi:hypothetical protein
VTGDPRAFFALDLGTATTSAALIARLAGRWRLIGHLAFPSGVDRELILGLLVERVRHADPELAESIGAGRPARDPGSGSSGPVDTAVRPEPLGPAAEWPRLVSRSAPARRLVLMVPTERRREITERAMRGTGWAVEARSLEKSDALAMTSLALDPAISVLVVGAGSPGAADERGPLPELVGLVAGVAYRRPELSIVLVGAAATLDRTLQPLRTEVSGAGRVVALPEDLAGVGGEDRLRACLDELRGEVADTRRGIVRSTESLAAVLGRRIETVDVGVTGGLRCSSDPPRAQDSAALTSWAIIASAGLVAADPDDRFVDAVHGWLPASVDRARLRDQLRDLWLAPWSEIQGDGATLRLGAARAALGRLVSATPEISELPAPDLLVAAGGAWAVAPAPAIALALADVVRRHGTSTLAHDHARLLGPLGSIEDESERRDLLASLADDLLSPLGSVIVPQSLRRGRLNGRIRLDDGRSAIERDLVADEVARLDLPPGAMATAELEFRDGAILGGRGRRFAVQVAGGTGGLMVDLRDVPLRLPDRPDARREALAGWQRDAWTALEG